MGELMFHAFTGIVWGIVFAAASWKDGKLAAIKLGVTVSVVMSLFSAGCQSIKPIDSSDCRPAGPGIYNDC